MDDMDKVIDLALSMRNIKFTGLHFHIGSQILVMDDFIALCHRINELQDKLEGGLGIDYDEPDKHPIPDFALYFATYAHHLKLRKGQKVHFELGRSIVAQCGSLISKVLYVKQGTNKQFAILDAGFTDLIRPALYHASHVIENISSTAPDEVYDVVGPICESTDVFKKDVQMHGTRRGDFIAIRSAGAYGEVMASQYNCRKLPKGVMYNG
jgi:diaminopimelate decarboxylase